MTARKGNAERQFSQSEGDMRTQNCLYQWNTHFLFNKVIKKHFNCTNSIKHDYTEASAK